LFSLGIIEEIGFRKSLLTFYQVLW